MAAEKGMPMPTDKPLEVRGWAVKWIDSDGTEHLSNADECDLIARVCAKMNKERLQATVVPVLITEVREEPSNA